MSYNGGGNPTRRQVLKAMGTLALAAGVPLRHSEVLVTALGGSPSPAPAVGAAASLRDVAAQKGILYGCAVNRRLLTQDEGYASLVAQQAGIIVGETETKWRAIVPQQPGKFNFEQGDELLHWAESHNIKMRGTALAWHEALPKWFDGYATRSNARDLLVNYIATVLRHWHGKLHSWDVVNEGITENGLRETPWLRLLGPDYMEVAFHAAEEADPSAIRVYNDMNMEGEKTADKRDQVLRLLDRLVSKKVPVQALGIQGHIRYDRGSFDAGKYGKFLNRVADLGLQIFITELDSRDPDSESEADRRDRKIASAYQEYLSTVLEQKAVKVVISWGLTDRYTWLKDFAPRKDGQPVRPLMFDQDFAPKAVFDVVKKAFESAPSR